MKIGDKVTIKKDLPNDWIRLESGISFNPNMREYAGKTCTIRNIGSGGYIYFKEIDWVWVDEWIEKRRYKKQDLLKLNKC